MINNHDQSRSARVIIWDSAGDLRYRMIIDPFAMEPTRTNVLQLPQILKEVPILEDSIDKIKKDIQILESRKKDLKTNKTAPIKVKGQLPSRFEEPDKWNYRVKKEHLMYTTTTNQYGFYKPTKHDMPVVFNGKSAKFSEHLNSAGPYRNQSLNT